MGNPLTEERGVLGVLVRILADGPRTPEELLARACTGIVRRFSLDGGAAVQIDEAGSRIVAQHEPDWPVEVPSSLEALPRRATLVETTAATVLVVPVRCDERVLGLVAGPIGFDAEPTAEELGALTSFGRVLGAYVDQAETVVSLRRLDEAKGQFVSLASHELRTPISVVHGVAATLHRRGDELAPEQLVELRRLLFEQTSRLAELTDQLLDLSRLDAGAVKLRNERFSPRERCETLLPRLAPERAADVEIEIDPGLEIVTDPSAFERVVSNLVVNALRYGAPPVTVRGHADGAFRLEVEDRGNGVDPNLVPQLFDRFTRGEHDRRSGLAGAGLGLAIAASFASALGGELGYEPPAPGGARFVFSLPLGDG